MSDLHISWDEYHRSIELLAEKIAASQLEFNQIICIARGGLRVGDILSRIFQQPLAIISASSYGGEDSRERGQLAIGSQIAMTNSQLGDRVLLVDDLVDSGVTLQQVQAALLDRHPEIQAIETAVIWYKSCSIYAPDYYVSYLPDNPWIHQPFEQYDDWDTHLHTSQELNQRNS
jgi:uncharacterized protein